MRALWNCAVPTPRTAKGRGMRAVKVPWTAARMRVVLFRERDRIYSRRLKRFTKKYGKPYWVACDVRAYSLACGDDPVQAINRLIRHVQATNLIAGEEKAKGGQVIRWRCLLKKKEVREFEAKAKMTGFILDGVKSPEMPRQWQRGLERLARKTKAKSSGEGLTDAR